METTPTAFDLNQAVRQWRAQLAQSPVLPGESLDELETHLRDSVASLQQRGLPEQEAFWVATRRLGSEAALQKEFAKLDPRSVWLDRVLWMLLGVLILRGIFALAGLIGIGRLLGLIWSFSISRQPAGGLAYFVKFFQMEWVWAGLELLLFALVLVALWRSLLDQSGRVPAWGRALLARRWRLVMFIIGTFVIGDMLCPVAVSLLWVKARKMGGVSFDATENMQVVLSSVEIGIILACTVWFARQRWLASNRSESEPWKFSGGEPASPAGESLSQPKAEVLKLTAELRQCGLSEAEAQGVAVQRLGGERQREEAAGRRLVWLERGFWMLLGFQSLYAIDALMSGAMMGTMAGMDALTQTFAVGGGGTDTGTMLAAVLFGGMRLLIFAAALALVWRWLMNGGNRFFPWCRQVLARGRTLGLLLAALYLLNWEFDQVQHVIINKTPGHYDWIMTGYLYGVVLGGLVESMALLILTLLLARRLRLAKT